MKPKPISIVRVATSDAHPVRQPTSTATSETLRTTSTSTKNVPGGKPGSTRNGPIGGKKNESVKESIQVNSGCMNSRNTPA